MKIGKIKPGAGWAWAIQGQLCNYAHGNKPELRMKPIPSATRVHVAIVPMKQYRADMEELERFRDYANRHGTPVTIAPVGGRTVGDPVRS